MSEAEQEAPQDAETDDGVEEADELVNMETLAGDIRDRFLSLLREVKKPWAELSEGEQGYLIDAVSGLSRAVVYRAVDIIHGAGMPTTRVIVGGVSFKKGSVQATITCPKWDPHRHLLADHVDAEVMIVIDDVSRFMGERAPATADPDEPPLPLDGDKATPEGEADDQSTEEREAE